MIKVKKATNLNFEGRVIRKNILVKKGEEINLTTVSVYDKPHQIGEVVIKAVVMDEAILKLKGMIRIEKGAKMCEGFLRQSVLLVGKNSRAEAIPELEIECNEVKASHAASIGRIDEDQLLYLMSRGLTKKESEKLIIKAFLA